MDNNYNFCDNAPATFGFCFRTECVSAGECLRGLAARDLTRERTGIHIVNPLRADTAGEATCPYFRKAERIAVAYGFKQAMSRLEAGKVRSVRAAICQLVCQRNYYYLLRGEKPIYPAMQEKISRILERHGASLPVEFDRYEWLYDW